MSNEMKSVQGTGIAVRGNEIDTDRVIPARFMKCVTFEGLGQYAFYDARFDEEGNAKEHPFNDERYVGGSVLIVNKNFGCGSSREHAPQALQKFGIRAIVGESFAEIFAGNCTVMGIPAVTASEADVEKLQSLVEDEPGTALTVDLDAMQVRAGELSVAAAMPDTYRSALTNGTWDSTAQLLANRDEIAETVARIPYLKQFA